MYKIGDITLTHPVYNIMCLVCGILHEVLPTELQIILICLYNVHRPPSPKTSRRYPTQTGDSWRLSIHGSCACKGYDMKSSFFQKILAELQCAGAFVQRLKSFGKTKHLIIGDQPMKNTFLTLWQQPESSFKCG